MSIGERVRQLREGWGLSLRALARLSGMTPTGISLIEQGVSTPSADTIQKLSKALGVTPGDLFASEAPKELSPPPASYEEMLKRARAEDSGLERPTEYWAEGNIGQLFDGLDAREAYELATHIRHARARVRDVYNSYINQDITEQQKIDLLRFDARAYERKVIANLKALAAQQQALSEAEERGDTEARKEIAGRLEDLEPAGGWR